MSSTTWRAFVALDLPADVQHRLGAMMAALQAAVPRGSVRWVRREGLHLTLKFYGEISPARLPDLRRVVSEAAGEINPLTFTLGDLGSFPSVNQPRVVWVGLAGDVDALHRLQQRVEAGSQPLGFAPEARRFSPHLTLGRVNQPLSVSVQSVLTQALRRAVIAPGEPFVLEALTLWRSELRPGGAVYTPLFSSPLGRPNG